jgi:adenylate kinase family enzyme
VAHRILVKGASGAGKSTLGRRLAERLAVPYVELDALHHGPNWAQASASQLKERVLERLDDDRGWIVDGNYDSKLGTLLVERATLIVWLDLSLTTKLGRLVRRTTRRWLHDEELWNGNRETLRHVLWGRDALFVWMVRTHFRQRRVWPRKFAERRLVRLRTSNEVAAWLATHSPVSSAPLLGVSSGVRTGRGL